jgi:hypothetical protein
MSWHCTVKRSLTLGIRSGVYGIGVGMSSFGFTALACAADNMESASLIFALRSGVLAVSQMVGLNQDETLPLLALVS